MLRCNARLVGAMTMGTVLGTVVGGLLAGLAPEALLVPLLAALLLASAVKVWRHDQAPSPARGRA